MIDYLSMRKAYVRARLEASTDEEGLLHDREQKILDDIDTLGNRSVMHSFRKCYPAAFASWVGDNGVRIDADGEPVESCPEVDEYLPEDKKMDQIRSELEKYSAELETACRAAGLPYDRFHMSTISGWWRVWYHKEDGGKTEVGCGNDPREAITEGLTSREARLLLLGKPEEDEEEEDGYDIFTTYVSKHVDNMPDAKRDKYAYLMLRLKLMREPDEEIVKLFRREHPQEFEEWLVCHDSVVDDDNRIVRNRRKLVRRMLVMCEQVYEGSELVSSSMLDTEDEQWYDEDMTLTKPGKRVRLAAKDPELKQ